jgi:CHASE3 domain sensor protein
MQELNKSVAIISNSNETQLELEKLLSVISIYETNLRSFIITKDENYIRDRFLSRGSIELNLKNLNNLASNNALRTKDIDSLKNLSITGLNCSAKPLPLPRLRKSISTSSMPNCWKAAGVLMTCVLCL